MKDKFDYYMTAAPKSEIAAALLCIAEELSTFNAHMKDFDHQICMGIRNGLFGNEASTMDSLLDAIKGLKEGEE